jgi:hypothetical protein
MSELFKDIPEFVEVRPTPSPASSLTAQDEHRRVHRGENGYARYVDPPPP